MQYRNTSLRVKRSNPAWMFLFLDCFASLAMTYKLCASLLLYSIYTALKLISSPLTECVSAPTDMKSTPVSA